MKFYTISNNWKQVICYLSHLQLTTEIQSLKIFLLSVTFIFNFSCFYFRIHSTFYLIFIIIHTLYLHKHILKSDRLCCYLSSCFVWFCVVLVVVNVSLGVFFDCTPTRNATFTHSSRRSLTTYNVRAYD